MTLMESIGVLNHAKLMINASFTILELSVHRHCKAKMDTNIQKKSKWFFSEDKKENY